MPRANRRVYQLARVAGRRAEEVVGAIRSLGIDLRSTNDLVPSHRLAEVEKYLGIDRYKVDTSWHRDSAPRIDGVGAHRTGEIEPDHTEESKPPPKPRLPKWPTVGQPTDRLLYLSAEQVEQIHWILADDFKKSKDPIDPPGLRSKDLLESAVHRTRTSLGAEVKYPTVPMVAAALLHAVISNHPFHNGNKRTALVATLAFLDVNGYVLEADDDELFDYLLRIAAHEVSSNGPGSDEEMLEIARWIHRHSRAVSIEEKVIKFHDLKAILRRYGCTFELAGRGNRINIQRDKRSTQVYYRNDGTDVERNTIRQIRRDLGLTDEEGYDSAIFYKAEQRIPAFIHRYRRTLSRLAKV